MATEMTVESALVIINEQLVFAPGWHVEAESFTHRFENTIRVIVTYPAFQTNRDQAKEGYPETINATAGFLVLLDCDDIVGLTRKLLTSVIFKICEHEHREMTRVRPTMWAPFHPHKIDGMDRWGEKVGDMMFGLA